MSSEQRQLIRLVSTILPRSGDEDVDQDKAQELLDYLLHQGVEAGHFSGNDVRCLPPPVPALRRHVSPLPRVHAPNASCITRCHTKRWAR